MTKELLTNLYTVEKKSAGEIATILDTNRSNILRYMSDFGIPRRTLKEAKLKVKKEY